MHRRPTIAIAAAAVLGLLSMMGCADSSNTDAETETPLSGSPAGGGATGVSTIDRELLASAADRDATGAVYVAPNGQDSDGRGAETAPYRTIAYALRQTGAGAIIVLRAGTYPEAVRIRSANTTLRGAAGEAARIQCPINDEDDFDVCVTFDVDSSGSRLQNVEVVGGFYYAVKLETRWDWGDPGNRSGASNILIEDSRIHGSGRDCIKITPGCDNVIIRRTEIFDSGRGYPPGTPADDKNAEGIDNVNGDRMLVQDSYVHDVASTGIYFKGGATECIVERTIVRNCGGGGIMVGFDTSPEFFDLAANPSYYEAIRGVVRNSIVVNTRYAGIGLYAAENARIYNNTIVNAAQSGHAGLYFGVTFQDWEPQARRPPSVDPILKNNLVLQSAAADAPAVAIRFADELGGLPGLRGMPAMDTNLYFNTFGPSRFSDGRPGAMLDGDLAAWAAHVAGEGASIEEHPQLDSEQRLTAGSPCIDRGEAIAAVSFDVDGTARTGRPDIGADERP